MLELRTDVDQAQWIEAVNHELQQFDQHLTTELKEPAMIRFESAMLRTYLMWKLAQTAKKNEAVPRG